MGSLLVIDCILVGNLLAIGVLLFWVCKVVSGRLVCKLLAIGVVVYWLFIGD